MTKRTGRPPGPKRMRVVAYVDASEYRRAQRILGPIGFSDWVRDCLRHLVEITRKP